MTAKTLNSGRTWRTARVMSGAAALAALLLTVGPAAAGTPGSRDDAAVGHSLLPSSMAGVAPMLEQHSRGGGSSGGGHAVPRGGSSGGSSGGGGSVSGGGSTGGGLRSGATAGGSSPTGTSGGNVAQPRTQGGTTATQSGDSGSSGTPTYSKPRDGQPATGKAVRREPGDVPPFVPIGGGGYYPIYYPWGWGGLGVGAYYGGYDPWGWSDPYPDGGSYDYDGKLKLKVKPRQADVFVDGYFSGSVDDYDGNFQELHLEPGPHRIEIRLEGYDTLSFEVRILPNQTVTYRGELRKHAATDANASGASTDRPELPER